jgi:glyceraldehyde 3-phosphate dehydrogenase
MSTAQGNVRVGINGFGRIGRDFLRYSIGDDAVEVVAVNDVIDSATSARLLRYDSTFGPFNHEVVDLGDGIAVDGRKIAVSAQRAPADIDWAAHGVEVVAECSGVFRTRETAGAHLSGDVRKVVISAPGKGVDATIVLGVNESTYDPAQHHVISCASCTTNCVAPMVKVLHDAFGVAQGYMTTVHAYTNDQNVLDAPHKDPRRARAAAVNIIPTTTGAARSVAQVIPEVAGRLDGVALRVPVVNGSLVDLAVQLEKDVTAEQINAAFKAAAESGSLAGRLVYTEDPIVSTDIIGNAASCVFDSKLTQAAGRMAKVFGWYDNEWGYTARLVELSKLVGAT